MQRHRFILGIILVLLMGIMPATFANDQDDPYIQGIASLEAGEWDDALIGDLEQVMRDASICGLGQAAPNPVRSIFKFFMNDRDQ